MEMLNLLSEDGRDDFTNDMAHDIMSIEDFNDGLQLAIKIIDMRIINLNYKRQMSSNDKVF